MTNSLVVSEMFYSIQGEGYYAGHLAVFLRLSGCNLQCSGFSYINPLNNEHLGCDTKAVWRQGKRYLFNTILDNWRKSNWIQALEQGAHLIITGGEPLLQQSKLQNFITFLDEQLKSSVFLELETNATIKIDSSLLTRLNHITVSPKLSFSKESRSKAYHADIIKEMSEQSHVYFKFVINNKQDINEILKDYIIPYAIPKERVYLMPEGGTQAELSKKQAWIIELCKKHNMQFSPRLHINIWNEATGV